MKASDLIAEKSGATPPPITAQLRAELLAILEHNDKYPPNHKRRVAALRVVEELREAGVQLADREALDRYCRHHLGRGWML
jgi:hypothetical protein